MDEHTSIAGPPHDASRTFVVLDDDPTGTQSVADLPVLTNWRVEDFDWAFDLHPAAVYVMTNSRSLSPADAERVNAEAVAAALTSSAGRGLQLGFVSRSDSTLRGHFPLEPDTIRDTLVAHGQPEPDGVILVPAFPDAGRITRGGVHGVLEGDRFTPINETEFARDSTFGFTSARLSDWVAEKSQGRIPADSVTLIELDTLRAGPDAVAERLAAAPAGAVIAVDAETESDLHALVAGLEQAEHQGKRYVYRVGPPFVRARIQQAPRVALTRDEILDTMPLPERGGLIVVGSHVNLTTRQLADLSAHHTKAATVELPVPALLDPTERDATIGEAVRRIVDLLAGSDVIVHTSRDLIRSDDPEESLAMSRSVSAAVVEVVRGVTAAARPRFVIAKGGITSSDVAKLGLDIDHAIVRGPLLPGIVSLWEPVGGRAAGIPYVVFAGNVGDATSLTRVVRKLTARPDDLSPRS